MSDGIDDALPIIRVADVSSEEARPRWLVASLWARASGVGILGGAPKCFKSWFALEMALAVASGAPCLGVFESGAVGPVLLYMAEDAAPALLKKRKTATQDARSGRSPPQAHVSIGPPSCAARSTWTSSAAPGAEAARRCLASHGRLPWATLFPSRGGFSRASPPFVIDRAQRERWRSQRSHLGF